MKKKEKYIWRKGQVIVTDAEATRKEELKAAMDKLRRWVEDNGTTG